MTILVAIGDLSSERDKFIHTIWAAGDTDTLTLIKTKKNASVPAFLPYKATEIQSVVDKISVLEGAILDEILHYAKEATEHLR